ncbi:MAG: hypothetical protein KGL53_14595, partial [Elusimicrobia bacterium]|nr:hypothetical protein [Elusimicrobiota bacterium]
VALVGHSRGGVIAHDWYRLAPPELKAKVSRLVLIQAPLGGTGYADWVLGTWWRRLVTRVLGWLLRADLAGTARELTRAARAAALAALPPMTPEDLAKTLVLRTVKRPGTDLYGRRARLLESMGEAESDGIVPADAARLPGAADIVLRDVDHSTTVLKRAGWLKRWRGYRPHLGYDAGDLTEALVRSLYR